MLLRFPPSGEPDVTAMQPLLGSPGMRHDAGRGPALPVAKHVAHEGVMSIVPRRFDEDPADMGIARFRDRPAGAFRATRILGGHEADESHHTPGGREAARIAEL